MSRLDAWHSPQQNASAFLRPFQILGPLLDTHPARHFAHRRQAGKIPFRTAQRLIRNSRNPRINHRLRQRGTRREVKIGENDLATPQ